MNRKKEEEFKRLKDSFNTRVRLRVIEEMGKINKLYSAIIFISGFLLGMGLFYLIFGVGR